MLKTLTKGVMAGCAVFLLGFLGSAHAQYMGPGQATAATTVADVLKNPVDDQMVTLRGRITKKLKKDYYEFRDDTGTIRVEIDNKYFYNARVTDATIVEIVGEVEKDFLQSPEIEVKGLSIVKP